ncbi:transporter, partial [Singulisphaera rosea]
GSGISPALGVQGRDDRVIRVRGQSGVDDVPRPSPEPEDGPPALRPRLGDLLNDSSEKEQEKDSTYFPEARDDPEEPDIRSPGPDTANFPNSPYTLPQGRFYVEVSPLFLSGASAGSPKTYNAEFLLRFGLTDRVELRLFGNGPTYEQGKGSANGMAPLAWDLKLNLWKENVKYYIPAAGLEVFLLTPSGSRRLNQGTQPGIALLFDHTLPYGFLLEWNVGLVGDPSPNNHFSALEPIAAWALQHEIVEGFDVFYHGYFNGATLPRFGDGVEMGGGAIWAVNKRLSLYGSYNAGLSKAAPNTLVQFGGAIAF